MSTALVTLLGNIMLIGSALLAIACVVAFWRGTQGDWRHSSLGRHLMAFMATHALILGLGLTRIILVDVLGMSDPWVFQWIRLAAFCLLPVVIAWRLVIIIKASHSRSIMIDEVTKNDLPDGLSSRHD